MTPKEEILVHFYPGNNSCPAAQLTRYVGDDAIEIPETGEWARRQEPGIKLFDQDRLTLTFPKMHEVKVLADGGEEASLWSSVSHRLSSWRSVVKHWWQGVEIEKSEEAPLNSGTYRYFRVDHNEKSLGQYSDWENFAAHHAKLEASELSDHKRIYFGVSRGGAATFSALARIKPENAALCILEGAPSSLSGLFKHKGERYFASRELGKWAYENLGTHFLGNRHQARKELQARAHVDEFPDTIPLMVVSSKNDSIVPHENTIRLAARLADKRRALIEEGRVGIAPVYLLQLDEVDHDQYATSDSNDTIRYRNAVHALYKKHNLDIYEEEYAIAGEEELNLSELTGGYYNSYFKFQREFWQAKGDNDARQVIRESALSELTQNERVTDKVDEPATQSRIEQVVRELPLISKAF